MKYFLLLFSILSFSFSSNSQSFVDIDDFLRVANSDPLQFESSVIAKGFVFKYTEGLNTLYTKGIEELELVISPRQVLYSFTRRQFYLEVNSQLIKKGYVLQKEALDSDIQEFKNGDITVKLYSQVIDDVNFYYINVDILKEIDVEDVTKVKKEKKVRKDREPSDKDELKYGYFSLGLVNSRGKMAADPNGGATISQTYRGTYGLGVNYGIDASIGGVAGINPLNEILPYYIDFGLIIGGQVGLAPFTLESFGDPYDDYTYIPFGRFGAGIGPLISIKPIYSSDFQLAFYYKIDAGANFGGTYESPSSTFLDETLLRDQMSFAWMKSFGFTIGNDMFYGGIEVMKYIDQGTFKYKSSYVDANYNTIQLGNETITAKLPFNQMVFKIGMKFGY